MRKPRSHETLTILAALVLFLGVNPIDEAFLLDLPDNRIIDHIIDSNFDHWIYLARVCDKDFHSRARYIRHASRILMVVV
jgi:hypothetical protein